MNSTILLLLSLLTLTPHECLSFVHGFTQPTAHASHSALTTKLNLFTSSSTIPTTSQTRSKQAITSIKSALSIPSPTLIEVEFPPLAELNKLGDGSLRSSLQAEDANVEFVSRLVKEITVPFIGSKVSVCVSSSASNSFLGKVRSKCGGGGEVYSLKDVGLDVMKKGSVCVVVTPSSAKDYRVAKELAEGGFKTVIVNGLFKDPKSIPPYAKMAYYLKPLTYNSQIAGYLIRQYPKPWTVVDAASNKVLGSFTDEQILVEKTNTPDLRESVRLAQKSVDERAIRDRK